MQHLVGVSVHKALLSQVGTPASPHGFGWGKAGQLSLTTDLTWVTMPAADT